VRDGGEGRAGDSTGRLVRALLLLAVAPVRLAPLLAAAALAAGCAGAAPTFRYRAEGSFGDGAAPVHIEPLARGAVEYRVESAAVTDPEASVVRVVRAVGDAPVRLDLGRVRLRAGGEDLPISRVCLLEPALRCTDGGAARGSVEAIAHGEALRVRVDFGPLEAVAPGGAGLNPALARLTLVDEGVYVSGRAVPVKISLERVPVR
jgi:hypothetical protein